MFEKILKIKKGIRNENTIFQLKKEKYESFLLKIETIVNDWQGPNRKQWTLGLNDVIKAATSSTTDIIHQKRNMQLSSTKHQFYFFQKSHIFIKATTM